MTPPRILRILLFEELENDSARVIKTRCKVSVVETELGWSNDSEEPGKF